MAMKKNGWTTFDNYPILNFGIDFGREWSIEEHFSFIEPYLELTTKYAICSVDLIEDSSSFISYLHNTWKSSGIFNPSYLVGYKHYSSQFNHPNTSIEFFEDGEIITKNINMICNDEYQACYVETISSGGFYFFKGRNLDSKTWVKNHLRPPIQININPKTEGMSFPHNSLVGEIRCDIWLDSVNQLKIWNPDGSSYKFAGEMDNSDLAIRNTPRLNRFLKDLKHLGEKFGGKWFFEPNGINVCEDFAILIDNKY